MTTGQSSPLTDTQWDAIFLKNNQSGLTQAAFCQAETLPLHQFKYRYQRSNRFVRKRAARKAKPSTHTKPISTPPEDKSRTVRRSEQNVSDGEHATVCIQLGERIRMQCPASVGIEALIRLAHEGLS